MARELIRVLWRWFCVAFERLRKLSFGPHVSVQGDLAFRGCHGSLFKVRLSWEPVLLRLRLNPLENYRLKGPTYETSTRIQGASGLHHLMANQWHIMVRTYASSVFQFLIWLTVFQADSLDRKFERPLRHHLDGYKTVVAVSISSVPLQPILTPSHRNVHHPTNVHSKRRVVSSGRQNSIT